MQQMLKRQYVKILCERFKMSRDMMYELAREGEFPLWVELSNVRVCSVYQPIPSSALHALFMFRVSNEILHALSHGPGFGVGGCAFYGKDEEGRPVRVEDPRMEEYLLRGDSFVETEESIKKELAEHFEHLEDSELLEEAGPRLAAADGFLKTLRAGLRLDNCQPCLKIYEKQLFARIEDVEAFEEKHKLGPYALTAQAIILEEETYGPASAIPINTLSDDKPVENYFIHCDGGWRVRFNRSNEFYLKEVGYIKTLIEYLQNPGKVLNKRELFSRLISTGSVNSKEGILKELELTSESPIKKISSGDRRTYQDAFKKLLEDHETFENLPLLEKQEMTEGEIEKTEDIILRFINCLKVEYGASCDREKREIIWLKNATERSQNTRSVENIPKHINSAIKAFKRIEAKGGLSGLSDHITKFLDKKNSIYNPPQDFPGWHVTL